jgi:PilZ domain
MVFGRTALSRRVPAQKAWDKRKSTRRPVMAEAWIRPDTGFGLRRCQVVDFSDKGVCIAIATGDLIPATFYLLMSRGAGLGRRAAVRWRRGNRIGAEFV